MVVRKPKTPARQMEHAQPIIACMQREEDNNTQIHKEYHLLLERLTRHGIRRKVGGMLACMQTVSHMSYCNVITSSALTCAKMISAR
jgi:hypothetical protein